MCITITEFTTEGQHLQKGIKTDWTISLQQSLEHHMGLSQSKGYKRHCSFHPAGHLCLNHNICITVHIFYLRNFMNIWCKPDPEMGLQFKPLANAKSSMQNSSSCLNERQWRTWVTRSSFRRSGRRKRYKGLIEGTEVLKNCKMKFLPFSKTIWLLFSVVMRTIGLHYMTICHYAGLKMYWDCKVKLQNVQSTQRKYKNHSYYDQNV